jgi:phenylacetate-CoA ligase
MNEYGCGEVGPIAFECPEGGLHLMSDNLYIEVLKEDGTSAQSGEIGQVVVTELHSWAMPLIRYQMMDNVEMGEERCPCGRTLPLIRQIIGRAYDFLKSKSGKRFHGEKVMYFLEHLQDLNLGVKMIQVVQPSLSELRIKVVPTPIFQPLALEMMQTYFYEALGDDVNVHFEMVDQIPREASGKLRVVVCDIK